MVQVAHLQLAVSAVEEIVELIAVLLAQILELKHKMEDQILAQAAAEEEIGELVMALGVL